MTGATATGTRDIGAVFVQVTRSRTADVEADHAALRARGVEVDPEIARTGTPRSGLVSDAGSRPGSVPAQFFLSEQHQQGWWTCRPPPRPHPAKRTPPLS